MQATAKMSASATAMSLTMLPQLLSAPAFAQAAMSVVAADHEPGPLGGMLPPYQDRHDCEESTSAELGPLMYPFALSHEYAAEGEPIWL